MIWAVQREAPRHRFFCVLVLYTPRRWRSSSSSACRCAASSCRLVSARCVVVCARCVVVADSCSSLDDCGGVAKSLT
eukprot:2982623-Prymnesium_polylepis.1